MDLVRLVVLIAGGAAIGWALRILPDTASPPPPRVAR